MKKVIIKSNDLGVAAYLRMFGWSCVGRSGRDFYFECLDTEVEEFKKQNFEYYDSKFADFDDQIMKLKRMGNYQPTDLSERLVS